MNNYDISHSDQYYIMHNLIHDNLPKYAETKVPRSFGGIHLATNGGTDGQNAP